MRQPHLQPDYDPIFNGLINYFKEMEWQRIEDDISIHEIIEILTDFAKMEKEESATHTPAAPAERKLTVVEDITFEGAAIVQAARKAEREKVLEWAKKHNWPTMGGHRVIGFDKLKEFLESLRGGAL